MDFRAKLSGFLSGQEEPESVGGNAADGDSTERELLDRPRKWSGGVFEPDPEQFRVFHEKGRDFATFGSRSGPPGLEIEVWKNDNGVGLKIADGVEQGLADRSEEAAGKQRAPVGRGPAAIDKHEPSVMRHKVRPDGVSNERNDFFRAFHQAGESPDDGGSNFRDLGRVGQ